MHTYDRQAILLPDKLLRTIVVGRFNLHSKELSHMFGKYSILMRFVWVKNSRLSCAENANANQYRGRVKKRRATFCGRNAPSIKVGTGFQDEFLAENERFVLRMQSP